MEREMNWFKKLFAASPHGHLPMPEVKPCKKEKSVSEPVLAMVKAWEKDKKRFNFHIEEDDLQDIEYRVTSNYSRYCKKYKIIIKDSRTDEVFQLSAYDTPANGQSVMYIPIRFCRESKEVIKRHSFNHKLYLSSHLAFTLYPSWITRDEVEYIYECVKDYYEERTNKYKELINYRIDRKLDAAIKLSQRAKAEERQRLMEIYK